VARTGRRPGNPDTREAILTAAREAFADRGFDGASVRAIALEAMRVPLDPGAVLTEALAGGADGVGVRLVRAMLAVWDSPAGAGAVAIVRSAVSNEIFARMFREAMSHLVLRRVAKGLRLDPAQARLRTALVASQMAGLIVMRYVIRLEPVASAPPETLVAMVGPTLQRYLTGPMPGSARTEESSI
jgi:AcrR family transcriptional regulator